MTHRRIIEGVLISGFALAGVAMVLATPACSPQEEGVRSTVRSEHAWRTGESLYAVASGLGHDSLQTRRAAAKKLASNSDMAPWVVMLILSSQASPVGDEDEQYRQAMRHPFELAVVAAVIDSLPEETDHSVLLALTYLLHEEERGEWSEKSGLVLQVISEHRSQPIRALARACLKQALGVDHEWDAPSWRKAIIESR